MIKKIKLVSVLSFCLTVIIIFTFGCLNDNTSSSGGLLTDVSKDEGESEKSSLTGVDIDEKLSDIERKIVSSPTIIPPLPDEELCSSGDRELIFIKGYADKGCNVEIYVNGLLVEGSIAVDDKGYFETSDGIEIIKGENEVELIAVSPVWGRSNPTKISIFLNVPEEVTFKVYDSADSLKEIEDTYFSRVSNPSVYIEGYCQPGSQVSLQVNDIVVSEYESDDGTFSFEEIELNLDNNEIVLWSLTSDGFTSVPASRDIVVSKDVCSPNPSDLSGYHDESGNHLSWLNSTDENFLSYKLVRVEDPCVNPDYPEDDVIYTFENVESDSYVDSDIEEGKSYFYTLWTLDKAGYAVSSSVLALPKPVYSISIDEVPPFEDVSAGRREWFYRYYEITNTGNVTVNLQPMMVWVKLDPEPDEEMLLSPLWEVHIWNPDSDEYYYDDENITSTHIADWVNTGGTTEVEEEPTYNDEDTDDDGVDDYFTKTVTKIKTTRKTAPGEGKRIMTVTVITTITVTDRTTGAIVSETTTTDTSTEIVEPEKIGNPIEGLGPGEKVKIAIKVQNVSAENFATITVHFHFAPVDCDGYFFTDEIVSTGDITVYSSGRN